MVACNVLVRQEGAQRECEKLDFAESGGANGGLSGKCRAHESAFGQYLVGS